MSAERGGGGRRVMEGPKERQRERESEREREGSGEE